MPQLMTMIFNAQKSGWSESWYLTKADVQAAIAAANTIASARSSLLGQYSFLEAVRVSDVEVLNDSAVTTFWSPKFDPTLGGERDTPWNSIYVRINAGTLYRRQMHMRGVPDFWIEWDGKLGDYTVAAPAFTNLNRFGTVLKAQGACIRAADKSLANFPYKVIQGITAPTAGGLEFTVPNHGFVIGDTVSFRKVTGIGLGNCKGRWIVTDSSTNTFRTATPPDSASTIVVYRGGGFVRKVFMNYFTITGVQYMRPTVKKTGRAFFVAPGRR